MTARRQVYLVEDTHSKSRERFAMKVLNMKRANKMANKATDSNIMAEDGASPAARCLSRRNKSCWSIDVGGYKTAEQRLCTTGDGDDVWVEVQVAQHVGPHPNIVGLVSSLAQSGAAPVMQRSFSDRLLVMRKTLRRSINVR